MLLLSTLLRLQVAHAAKILFIAMPNGKSHRGSMYPLAKSLADRGHQVVFWAESLLEESKPPKGVEEHLIKVDGVPDDIRDAFAHGNTSLIVDMQWNSVGSATSVTPLYFLMGGVFRQMLATNRKATDFVLNGKWDLIMVDSLFTNSGPTLSMSGANAKVPHCLMHTSYQLPELPFLKSAGKHVLVESPKYPWNLDYTGPTSFRARWGLFLESVEAFTLNLPLSGLFVDYSAYVYSGKLWASLGTYNSFVRSTVLDFSDFPERLASPTATMHTSIDYGSSCPGSEGKALPEEWESFVNDTRSKGTVLIAFGTIAKWHTAPAEVLAEFVAGLSALTEYRVIFQYAGPKLDLPAHIRTSPWIPQADILGHPKTKVFVSHGGLKSHKDAICMGTPFLLIPLFGDQPHIALRAKLLGYGLALWKKNIKADAVSKMIREVASNDKYGIRVKQIRDQMVDRILPSLSVASFRAEQLLRYPSLGGWSRHAGRRLHFWQYWCLDIAAVALLSALATLYLGWTAVGKCLLK